LPLLRPLAYFLVLPRARSRSSGGRLQSSQTGILRESLPGRLRPALPGTSPKIRFVRVAPPHDRSQLPHKTNLANPVYSVKPKASDAVAEKWDRGKTDLGANGRGRYKQRRHVARLAITAGINPNSHWNKGPLNRTTLPLPAPSVTTRLFS
jgi:hypothetical protein